MNRRDFLKSSAALSAASLAATILPNAHVAFAADQKKYRAGLIGTGWYGKVDLLRLIQVSPVEVVSLCDVDSQMLANAAEIVSTRQQSKKKPRTFSDYREMLKEKDLDLCLIGTPDHWHALTMIAACEAGCDVYCQKPISVDVREGETMLATARRLKRVVQVGTQRRSTPHLIDAKKKVIDAGLLGKIGHAEICNYGRKGNENPPDGKPPENLNYEMWVGPAPMRPYNPMFHPKKWRQFMEFGNGTMGDMGIHMFDAVRWMLGLGWPTGISSDGGIRVLKEGKANITDTQVATFSFPEIDVVWNHRMYGVPPDPKYTWSFSIIGDKGTLKGSVFGYDFIPNGKGEPIHQDFVQEEDKYPEDKTEKDLERHVASAVRGHMRNFLEAVESRGKPVADIEQGFISSSSCILANVSQKLGGRQLKYDPEKKEVTGDAEATALLKRTYRAPWKHPSES